MIANYRNKYNNTMFVEESVTKSRVLHMYYGYVSIECASRRKIKKICLQSAVRRKRCQQIKAMQAMLQGENIKKIIHHNVTIIESEILLHNQM